MGNSKWVLWGIVFLGLSITGCSSKTIASRPLKTHVVPTEILSTFNEEELQQASKCHFWEVCEYEAYEEYAPMGPNFLYEDYQNYLSQENCFFDECSRVAGKRVRNNN